MALFGRSTSSSDSSNGDDYGQWAADDADNMTRFDAAKSRQTAATTRTPAKAADVLGALLGGKTR